MVYGMYLYSDYTGTPSLLTENISSQERQINQKLVWSSNNRAVLGGPVVVASGKEALMSYSFLLFFPNA